MCAYQRELDEIKKLLKSNPRGMIISDISRKIKINRNTVARYLDVLLVSGQAEVKPVGSARLFFSSRRVPLTSILNHSSDSILVFDRNLKIVQANDNFANLIGMQKNDLIGIGLEDASLRIVSDSKMVSQIRAALDGASSTLEVCSEVNGETLHFSAKLFPTNFENGTPGVSLIMDNITKRKLAEETLRAREVQYRLLLESLYDIVFVIDRNDCYSQYYSSSDTMLSAPPEEFLGKSLKEVLPSGLASRYLKLIQRVRTSGKNKTFDYQLDMGGKQHWFSAIITPHEDNESVVFVLRNISARKEAERRIQQERDFMKLVCESLHHPFYVIDVNSYTIKMANSAANFGPTTGDCTCYALTHRRSSPCEGKEHPCPLEEVKRTKKPVQVVHNHYDADGNVRHVAVHAHPIIDDQGQVTQMIEYNIDITERRRAEKALRESEERYRTVFEGAAEGILVVETKTRQFKYVNPAICRMLGYAEDELIGMQVDDIHPRDALESILPIFLDSTDLQAQSTGMDIPCLRSDGTTLYANFKGVPTSIGGEDYIVGFFTIVTDRRGA